MALTDAQIAQIAEKIFILRAPVLRKNATDGEFKARALRHMSRKILFN